MHVSVMFAHHHGDVVTWWLLAAVLAECCDQTQTGDSSALQDETDFLHYQTPVWVAPCSLRRRKGKERIKKGDNEVEIKASKYFSGEKTT